MPEAEYITDNSESIAREPTVFKTAKDEAIEAWREFLDALCPYLKITGEMCVKNIAKMVMLKIWKYVNEENTFTSHDEKIFEHYAAIMKGYSETAHIYGESFSKISDLKIGEILSGISEILAAQLNQYEEHFGGKAHQSAAENPIRIEKNLIMKSVSETVMDGLKTVWDNIFSENGYFEENELKSFCYESAEKSVNESHIDLFAFMYRRLIEKGGLDIYKSYSGAIMECKRVVNSLELRKETRYFYEALKQEKETLDSIVKIQLSALTEELEKSGADDEERHGVEEIIKSLTETLALAEKETSELNRIFGEAEGSVIMPVLMNYDDFLSFIEETGLCACEDRMRGEGLETGTLSSVQLWKEKLDNFIKKFGTFADENIKPYVDTLPYKKFLYEMRLRITDKLILTDEILKGVKELAGFYSENEDRLRQNIQEEYMKIIEGINESILIKTDVLEEGRKAFEDEAFGKLANCAPPELSEEDLETLRMLRMNVWRDELIGADIYSADYYDQARDSVPLILSRMNEICGTEEYDVRTDKKTDKERNGFFKLEASYLRDCLLFEIITFEEILTYSVSKLKESESETAAEYAARCDALAETLVKLCKLHNILIISPQPFDAFNSSEHEVLVAEKNESFKKGQIIKMMNSGFKYNEAVLVRANVIAAK